MLARLGWFERVIVIIGAAALVLRAYYTLGIERHLAGPGDFYFYHWSANLIADGRGYIEPFRVAYENITEPTALHPPLWSFLLSVVSWFGGTGEAVGHLGAGDYFAHRLTGAVCGTVTVVLVGYLGRRVGGERVGVVAAATAALYPVLIVTDGSLLSESLYGVLITSALILSYRLMASHTTQRAVALGAVVGFAALTREEAVLLVPLLLIPLAGVPRQWLRRRVPPRLIVIACLSAMVVIAPWAIRNWVVFDQPVLIGNGSGAVLAGANCNLTYRGHSIGFWDIRCVPPKGRGSEADYSDRWRDKGLTYAEHHFGRLVVVGVVRMLRTWSLYQTTDDPGQKSQPLAVAVYLVLLPLAVIGFFLLKRRRRPLVVLLAPVLLVTLTSLVGYGTTRFRHAAEMSFVVFAAIAVVYLWDRRRELVSLTTRARAMAGPPD